MEKFMKMILVFFVILLNVGCDQLSKEIVRRTVFPNEIISILDNNIIVTNVENTGAMLSIGDSLPEPIKFILLSFFPLVIVLFCIVYILRKQNIRRSMLFAVCCILGGGIGNLFDRVAHGSVTDFMHINLGIFRTGIFNAADVSIMTGALLVLVLSVSKTSISETEQINP